MSASGAGWVSPAPSGAASEVAPGRCVAYVMSRFPRLTETFVLDEILGLEARGVRVEVHPLWRERADVLHPEAQAVVDRAHFRPTLDLRILRDNLRALGRAPARYLSTLGVLLRANRRSPRFLLGALAIFPKSVSMAEALRTSGVQHVHAHFASHPAAAAFVIGRLAGLPWSFTAHGSDLHREQSMLAEKVAEARFVVAISEFNRRFIETRVAPADRDKLKVIHCGVDLARFAAQPAPVAPHSTRFVCVGTLHAVKGQSQLIEACAVLRARGVAFECVLVGDGPDRARLEAGVRQHALEPFVRFLGALDRVGVRAALASADVAVAPSVPTADGRREGIPVVLMEAGACGLPLVASRLSGIPELVRDGRNGCLVEPGDVAGLADALERLAADPDARRRLGREARATVERDFQLAGSLDQLCRAFFGDPADGPARDAADHEGAQPLVAGAEGRS